MENILKDKRFSHIPKDPRFRRVPKNVRKVKVDKRFSAMFDKKEFNAKSKLDERGRALDLKPSENLKKLYNTTNDSSEEEEDVSNIKDSIKPKVRDTKTSKNRMKESDKDNTQDSSSESEESESDSGKELKSKESGKLESEESEESESEESESSSDEDSSAQEDFDHRWEEFDEEAVMADDISRRLAVCNMDWDRIGASDLFVVFNSFKLENGTICSVKIYPSEFGLKRMEEEKIKGPSELVEKTLGSDEEEDLEDKNSSKYNREKLRQYQINRLKYYYAIVECDSPQTAKYLYDQLNGMEYESSSVRFDLRFVPDDTTFDQEPTSVAESCPDPTEYKPKLFVTTALQQVKVNLTWDETDPHRRETLEKAFKDPDSVEKNIKDYLASSSEESEVEVEDEGKKLSTKERIANYRALLLNLEEKEKKEEFEKEITWDPDVKEKTIQIVKEKQDSTTTPFEEILKKKKERKQKKQREKLEIKNKNDEFNSDDSDLFSDDDSSKKNANQLAELHLISDTKELDTCQGKKKGKKFKKKKKETKKNEFKCDVLDPRFSAIYTSHDYNIDPSNPHFKNTEGSLAIIKEKQKNRLNERDLPDERKSKKMKQR